MDSKTIVEQLEFAQQAITDQRSWFDFVSRIDRLLEGLDLLEHQPGDRLQAARDLNRTLLDHWKGLAGKDSGLLLAELYGLCQTSEALAEGIEVLQKLWELERDDGDLREQGRSVARGYLASLALIDSLFPKYFPIQV